MADANRHLVVKGRVQGVGFRWFVVDAARRLELAGWVRNLDDGSVEIHAAGAEHALKELEALISKGPPGARIAQIHVTEASAGGDLQRPFRASR